MYGFVSRQFSHIVPGLMVLVVLLQSCDAFAGEFVIAKDGELRAALVTPANSSSSEKLAAKEISEHVELIVGKPLLMIAADELPAKLPEGSRPIYIGGAAGDRLGDALAALGENEDAFAISVGEGEIALSGVGDSGTIYAGYELLERLGVRWFMPGETGLVLPDTKTLALAEQQIAERPSFVARSVGSPNRTWARRNRLSGPPVGSSLRMPSVGSFDEHPERYALVDGERYKGQLCLSNEQTYNAFVQHVRDYFERKPGAQWLGIGNHGGGHCECADCRSLDSDEHYGPFAGGINVTDRYIWFLNRVLAEVRDDLPEKRICMTIATPHIAPPAREIGHPNLDIQAWLNAYCRIHGVNNPACPERMMALEQTREWVTKLKGDYYERTNWGNVAGPGFLFPLVHRYRQDMPAYHAAGVAGVRGHAYSHWASENPSSYIGAKLAWNHEADVDALLADFYGKYYGPAAAPMQKYHELAERTARDADFHTGTAIDSPNIFTAKVRQQLNSHLNDARKLAGEGMYATRVEIVELAQAYTDAFARMVEHRNHFRFDEAVKAMGEAEAARDKLIGDYEPSVLAGNFARSYFDHFFGKPLREAVVRASKPNRLLAGLDDAWSFKLDFSNLGVRHGWHLPEATGGNWQPLKVYSLSWSDQGLRYYEGAAWYRQRVKLPADVKGRVMLWFSGVDEHATVWVNGMKVGESHRNVFKPFEFDVTEAVRPGETNTVVVRAENVTLDEVGTGGLLGPVMFYSRPAE